MAFSFPKATVRTLRHLLSPPKANAISFLDFPPVGAGEECVICYETLGRQRADGTAEKIAMLPCLHVFCSICITTWLQKSPNYDCPSCRQSMKYQVCRHAVKPREVAAGVEEGAAGVERVSEAMMPTKCPACRAFYGALESEERERVRWVKAEYDALEGLAMLPRILGGMCQYNQGDIDRRKKERADWRRESSSRRSLEAQSGSAW